MRSRLIRIGRFRGLILSKQLTDQAGLANTVDIHAHDGAIVIRNARAVRAGWEEAATQAHERGDDELLATPAPTYFDDEQWDWYGC